SDGDYAKAVKNAAELTKYLMDKHGLGIDKVKQHHDWYPKDCPAQLRAGYKGITWSDFLSMVKGVQPSKPTPSAKPKPATSGSIVDYLNSIGDNSSFANRAKLAAQHGIKGYTGTAAQNLDLLAKIKQGAKPAQANPKKGAQRTTRIVGDLKSMGASSSTTNRKKLAAKYGSRKYSGTAAQNTQLLRNLRG